jgi:4-hydroxybenzoate polyprenyltransferase
MATDPSPAARTTRSPKFVFLICLVAALVSAIWVLGILTIVAAVVLVVTAMVLQARGKNPATWFAASTGVAAGTLIYLVIVLVTGQ